MKPRSLIVAALLMTIGLTALDSTIMATAMPRIVGSLGGLSLFSWGFSIYLLTSTVTVPIYGKLADLYGRKPVLLFGAGLFLVGSVLCGLSSSMAMLIVFRAVQGLGAGALQPVTMTIIGDLFPIEQRARIQGMTGSVWGVASVAGPAIGGIVTDQLGWRWVFFLNLPLGLAAISMVMAYYKEDAAEKREHAVDYLGAALLSAAIVALLMGLLQGVRVYGWGAAETWSLFGLSAFFLVAFGVQEARAAEPVVPAGLFRSRVIVISSLAGFLGGGLMFGVDSYVPLFAQGVYGSSAIQAGLLLAPMSAAWTAAGYASGRAIVRWGYFPSAIAGAVCLTIGSAGLLTITAGSGRWLTAWPVTIIGLGMGFTTSALLISVQNTVGREQRGIATASVLFFRMIGGSISVAVMGAFLNSQMASRLGEIGGIPAGVDGNSLLNEEFRAGLSPDVLDAIRRALAGSLHDVYLIVFAIAMLSLAVMLFFPRARVELLSHRPGVTTSEAGVATGVAPPPRSAERGGIG